MERLIDRVIVPCAFHDFKDTAKPQCMLFVNQSKTVTTVLFRICFPIRLIFFTCCGVLLLLLFVCLLVCCGLSWGFYFRFKAQIKILMF